MPSIFAISRDTDIDNPEEKTSIFSESRNFKQNIIPPVGIAKPELVNTFIENIGNDEEILKHISDVEAYERETPSETIKRKVLAHGARGFENYAGAFGDMQSFAEAMTGIQYPKKEEPTKESLAKFRFPDIEAFEGPNPFAYKAPTTNELREVTKKSTGRYLEPKDESEKVSQELVGDVSSMANPIAGLGLGWWQKLLLPLAGQTAKQSLKATGATEKEQDIGKMATMGLLSIANLGNARNVAIEAINEARNMIPRGLRFNAQPTITALNNIRNQPWFRTGRDATKGPAFDAIQRIDDAIQNGFINAQDAMQLRTDISNARRSLGGYNVPGNPDRRAALHHLDQVDRALLGSMETYGTNVNPRWWRAYNQGNEAYRITQRSEAISNFLSSKYGKPLTSQTAKTVFGVGLAHGALHHIPIVGMGLGGLLAARKSFQVINRMIRSPVLRSHYLNVIGAASRGNATLMAKELDKFDREAKKMEGKINPNPDGQSEH